MKFAICVLLGLLGLATVKVSAGLVKIDPWLARIFVSNDFESGTMSPWFDQSPARVNWKVEDVTAPTEVDSPAPASSTGTKYLRATRNADLASGLAVLHSPVFTALPGDKVRFSFWIRSRQPQANNLELYYAIGNKETLLIGLSQFSSSSNFEWRTASVDLPFNTTTDISLVFYGFCGSNPEDAIGLDNVVVGTPESTESPTTLAPTTTTAQPGCNAVLNVPSGSFSSPNYPNVYGNNLECNWLIVGPSNTRVFVSFSDFYTQSGVDVVKFYDGGSTSSTLLAAFSGSSLPGTIESSDNVMLVTFTTDGSVTYRGFSANYFSAGTTTRSTTYPTHDYFTTQSTTTEYWYPTTEYPNCNNYYYYNGEISSPNYPSNYPNNVNCFYYLDSVYRGGIYLDFLSFSTESGYDYVRVYEGWSTSGTLLLSASGNSIPSSVYTTRTNRLLVHFYSDGSNTARGFQAFFQDMLTTTTEPTTEAASSTPFYCGDTLTSNSGAVASPNYPYNYPNNLDCETLIRVSSGYRIRVTFTDFSTESGSDFLTIYNGPTTSSTQLLRTSGQSRPAQVTSSSNQILVRFTTDGRNTYGGWRFTYTTV